MDKSKRLSFIFSISYAVVLILALLFFFYDFLIKQITNYPLMVIILSGTFSYLILSVILREKQSGEV